MKKGLQDIRYENFSVDTSTGLMDFLTAIYESKGRNSIKSMLAREQVMVNGTVQTQFDFPLEQGHTVSVMKNNYAKNDAILSGVKVLFEDEDLIVIEKDAGLLTIATEKEKSKTAYHELMNYIKGVNRRNRIYIVHRLDRETSGVMIFAKSEKAKNKLQYEWKKLVKRRVYVALVEGNVQREEGTVTSYLVENNKSMKVHSTNDQKNGKKAITHYKKLQSNGKYTLLEVHLDTGRKNQIRVHMQDLGHSIVGDKKYGAKSNPMKRLGLHARKITFVHPVSGVEMNFVTKVPKPFKRLLKEK
ncbi:RluA family pseudouridine synthase [Bacillaceae bacterium W0354]